MLIIGTYEIMYMMKKETATDRKNSLMIVNRQYDDCAPIWESINDILTTDFYGVLPIYTLDNGLKVKVLSRESIRGDQYYRVDIGGGTEPGYMLAEDLKEK